MLNFNCSCCNKVVDYCKGFYCTVPGIEYKPLVYICMSCLDTRLKLYLSKEDAMKDL